MDFDEHATFSERYCDSGLVTSPLTDFEDGEDLAAMGSGMSVASSEWRNVSSSSSSSSVGDQLTAKDIVNWREFREVWFTHHPVIMTDIRDVPLAHPLSQDIHSVFQFAYSIPWSRLNMYPAEHIPDALQKFLTQVMETDPNIFSQNATVYPQLNSENGLAIAGVALEVHHAALRLAQEGGDTIPDEYWSTQVHDALIVRCARGRLLKSSEAWTLQARDQSYSQNDLTPTSAKILRVRRFQPHGGVLVVPEAGTAALEQVLPTDSNIPLSLAAVFSTRSQVTSWLRDTPESVALHSFSLMATSTLLTQMSTWGINLPVFGAMLDRNIVRLHVDWSIPALGNHVSVPLSHTDISVSRQSPFRDFDLTLPQDSLRVAFIFDALGAYAQCRLAPAVRAISNSWQGSSQFSSHLEGLSFGLNEISSEEKVQAWMQNGVVAEVAANGICD